MTENVRKLVGVVVIAALVVVGVVTTSGGDDDVDFTRNTLVILAAFAKLPEVEQARLAPAFLQQAAPKSLDTGPINKINKEVGPIAKGAKASISLSIPANSLSTGKASVLEGRGVDGKGGTSSMFSEGVHNNGGISGATGKAGIWLQSGGTEGVADRILECASGGNEEMKERAGASDVVLLVILAAFRAPDAEGIQEACANGTFLQGAVPDAVRIPVDPAQAKLLAECMESRVGGVFLESHVRSSAKDCVAIVLPELSPKRAKQLGVYWQTPEQLVGTD